MPQRTDDLSEKQKECLRLVHHGLTSKEIAQRLDLTPGTVNNYINVALGKLGLTSRREAARLLASEEDGTVQRLHLQSPDLAIPLLDDGQAMQATDGQDHRVRLLSLPPVGGNDNALTTPQRVIAISRIGFASALTLIAMVVIVQGIVTLLT